MTEIEHGLAGDLLGVNFERIAAVFGEAGFDVDHPHSVELILTNEQVEIDVYPRTTGLSEENDPYLISGVIECSTAQLETVVEQLAKLFVAAGVIYNLEYDVEQSGTLGNRKHPDFAHPPPKKLDASYTLESGNPYQPCGLDRMCIQPDGSFTFERQEGEHTRRMRGRLGVGAIASLASELAAARFPHVPEHDTPPGPTYLTVSSSDGRSAMVSLYSRFVGYGHIIERVLEWTKYLRGEHSKKPHEMVVDEPPIDQ